MTIIPLTQDDIKEGMVVMFRPDLAEYNLELVRGGTMSGHDMAHINPTALAGVTARVVKVWTTDNDPYTVEVELMHRDAEVYGGAIDAWLFAPEEFVSVEAPNHG